MQFKKLTIDDYELIVSLWTKAGLPFRPRGRDGKKAIGTEMSANPDLFLGAFEDGHLVAVVVLSSDGRKGWINRLAVDPIHRHKGIAKALIRESERILRKTGVRMFCALIDRDNAASKKLFTECGYDEHTDIIYFSKRDDDQV
jgi:ribosomal protein S18 acetylase RimI-like enzyme